MFGNKPSFGTTTTFGSGSFGSSAPFGQNTSAFGANKPLGTGFGTPQFGSAAPNTSIFSGSGTSGGGIFGGNTSNFGQAGTSTSSFGFTSGTNTGTGLFGSTTQPNAGSSIFQSPAPSAFGAPKTTFGGFGSTGSTGLFGQNQQQSTSLFGQSTSTGTGGLFGSSGGTFSAFGTTTGPNGTTVKFNPVTGTDTMSKNGVTNAISIRHQCITVMKEYESKSLEELRMEDYLANRKGPQQSTLGTFGGGQSSLFGPSTSTASTGLFGSTQNKPLFGTSTNAFGTSTSTGGLFGQTNQAQSNSLFNKPLGFGTPTTTSSVFSFGTNQTTSVFGGAAANQAKPLFGNQTAGTGIFGSNNPLQTSIGFGTGTTGFGSTLGTTNQSTTLPFGSKAPFGPTTTSSFSFGGPTNPTTGSSIFGAKPAGTTNTLFGTTNTFGTAGPTFGGFGNTANTGSSFFSMNKPATSFGIGSGTNCFGTGLGGTTTTNMNNLFGNNANKSGGLMMGTNFLGTGTSAFGTGTGLNLAGTGGLNSTTTLGTLGGDQNASQLAQQQNQALQQLLAMAQSPFGDSPLFRSVLQDTGKREEVLKPTNPVAQKALTINNQYKVSPRPTSKAKPKSLHIIPNGKTSLFDGLEDDDSVLSPDAFIPRKSVKKLSLKPKISQVNGYNSHNDSQNSVIENSGIVSMPVLNMNKSPSLTTPLRQDISSDTNQVDLNDNHPDKREHKSDSVVGTYYTNPITKPIAELATRRNDLEETVVTLNNKNRSLNEQDDSEKENASQDFSSEGSFENDSEPEASEPEHPHPAGVVLTRSGYYTIPSLEELASHLDENGNCFVPDFAVGREGFGCVYFFGTTNVAGLNLDEIVHFRRREVTVYPDDDNRPPFGGGLNKKAQITLDGVWPTNKTTSEIIKDPIQLKSMKFQERLEKAAVKLGAKFVDYRPETGSWVFQVNHFSKYGLEDSDDEEMVVPSKELKLKPPLAAQQNSQLLKLSQQQQQKSFNIQISKQSNLNELDKQHLSNGFDQPSHPFKTPDDDDDDEMKDVSQLSQEPFPEEFEDAEDMTESVTHHIAVAAGIDSHRVQSMKASLFANGDDESYDNEELSQLIPKSKSLRVIEPSYSRLDTGKTLRDLRPKSTVPFRVDSPVLMEGPVHRLIKPKSILPSHSKLAVITQPEEDNLSRYALLPSGAPPLGHPRKPIAIGRLQGCLPLSQSLLNNSQHLESDAGCFMARRFRVGWGPNWTIAHLGKTLNQENVSKPSSPSSFFTGLSKQKPQLDSAAFIVTIESLQDLQIPQSKDNVSMNNLHKHFEVLLEHSCGTVENGCPYFIPKPGVDVLHQQADLVTQQSANSPMSHSDAIYLEHWKHVWDLCVALWGRIPGYNEGIEQDNPYAQHIARRKAFSEWLQSSCSQKIKKEIQENKLEGNGYLRTILSHLSGYQFSEACQLAQKSGDHRMALLLAQAAGSIHCRSMIQKQLENWEELKADKFFIYERLKIYALLAGTLVWPSSESTVNTCEGMDWKRALATHLWYLCSPITTIADALNEYDKAYLGRNPHGNYCQAPRPPYVEENPSVLSELSNHNSDDDSLTIYDTCYHLIKLYVQKSHRLDRLLTPATSTPNHLDNRLSWPLFQALRAVGYEHLSEYQANSLHLSFASQLEAMGLWHWAAFVILHIADPQRRFTELMELLKRHVSLKEDSEKEELLHEKLLIPKEWIFKAKALRAHYEGKTHDEAWYLLKGGCWNNSHEIILRHVAPDAIINENFDYLKTFLLELAPTERSSTIMNWNIGGKIYLDYIYISDSLEEVLKRKADAYILERLQPEVSSLCNRVGSIHCYSAKDRLCQSEIAKKTANLLRAVLSLQSITIPSRLLAPHLGRLPMPEDCILQELQALCQSFLTEITS